MGIQCCQVYILLMARDMFSVKEDRGEASKRLGEAEEALLPVRAVCT